MIAIGRTPLLKLERLAEPGCADIYVKYEGANPTGSMKDRMAFSMIEGAERRGQLRPGGAVRPRRIVCDAELDRGPGAHSQHRRLQFYRVWQVG